MMPPSLAQAVAKALSTEELEVLVAERDRRRLAQMSDAEIDEAAAVGTARFDPVPFTAIEDRKAAPE